MNPIAERLVSFTVYDKTQEIMGVADVELPAIGYLSDAVEGSGIAGQIDVPIFGHFESLPMKINWQTMAKSAVRLAAPGVHHLEFWGATQVQEAGTGDYHIAQTKVVVRGMPKKAELGKLAVGASTDTANEFELTYVKVTQDGETTVEIDKLNYICIFNGVDYLKKVRQALGKE